jgi:hypothetical protein
MTVGEQRRHPCLNRAIAVVHAAVVVRVGVAAIALGDPRVGILCRRRRRRGGRRLRRGSCRCRWRASFGWSRRSGGRCLRRRSCRRSWRARWGRGLGRRGSLRIHRGRRGDGCLSRGARCAGRRAAAGHDERHTYRSEPDQSGAPTLAPRDLGAGRDPFHRAWQAEHRHYQRFGLWANHGLSLLWCNPKASELLRDSRGCGVCLRRCALGQKTHLQQDPSPIYYSLS